MYVSLLSSRGAGGSCSSCKINAWKYSHMNVGLLVLIYLLMTIQNMQWNVHNMVLKYYFLIIIIAIHGVKPQMDQCILSSQECKIGMKFKSIFWPEHMIRDDKFECKNSPKLIR